MAAPSAPAPSVTAPPVATPPDVVAGAAALTPLLRDRAAEAERLATLPPDVVAALAGAGLFRLMTPAGLGGLELPPPTVFEVIETLARADGSAGWTAMIGNSGLFLAWMDQDLAAGLLDGHADQAMTGTFAPEGRGIVEPGGLRLSGHWTFNSGCPHARLYCAGLMALDGPGPRMIGGRPDWRWAVFPASAATVVPTWEGALGLRGSGSHDVVVDGLLVPEGHTVMPFHEPPRVDSALYRVPFFSVLKMLVVGLPLGIARHALDLVIELARTKVRSGPGPIAEEQDVQIRIGQAEAGVRGARAFVLDEIENLWGLAQAGDRPTDADLARFTLASNAAMQASLAAVDEAFALAGARALYAGDEIGRCWRDLHAAGRHRVFGRSQWEGGAKALMGLEVDRAWL
jgi:indole-3-acetate monooxygenase